MRIRTFVRTKGSKFSGYKSSQFYLNDQIGETQNIFMYSISRY